MHLNIILHIKLLLIGLIKIPLVSGMELEKHKLQHLYICFNFSNFRVHHAH